ncbi:MAG: GAF domain-containing protein [Deltaproteobacteria bacterium]|nr:MAG: GAF domain-containing protein [Deltaproteobacteria bacterium]
MLLSALVVATLGLVRSGETRLVVLLGLILFLAAQQGVVLWILGHAQLGLNPITTLAVLGLGASILTLGAALAMNRTVNELDRAEALHWENMEGVRGLTDLAARRETSLEDRMPVLLEMTCKRLGLAIGLVTRIRTDRYEVLFLRAPEDFPVFKGSSFDLGETHAARTIQCDRPVAVQSLQEAHWLERPGRSALGFEAYLGTAIYVGNEVFGTLEFASLEPRSERFTASHKDLLVLMAQWIGTEMERDTVAQISSPPPPRAAARRVRVRPRKIPDTPVLHLNAVLERLERRIQRVLGPRVNVVVKLAPGLEPARDLHLPIDAIILSLVRKAAESMDPGGNLTITTSNLELAGRDPDVMRPVAPNRYVTLAVHSPGGGINADALARVFDSEEEAVDGHTAARAAEGRMPLSAAYRILQRAGGDLSVEVDPALGTTFVVFLPLANQPTPEASPQPGGEASEIEPAAPPPTY